MPRDATGPPVAGAWPPALELAGDGAGEVDGRERSAEVAAASPPFIGMLAGPACLDPVEPIARKMYADGWRPQLDDGPSRRELAEVVARAAG